MNSRTIYDFEATTLKGEVICLSQFQGKTLLIVNTASDCGFTTQFAELEELFRKYQPTGFVVLGFPCNQFGKQEPGSSSDIQAFCSKNYGVSFPMFEKTLVNGRHAHPIFQFLKASQNGWFGRRIKWNFTKFLVDAQGKPVGRFSPMTKPKQLEDKIVSLLQHAKSRKETGAYES